MQQLTQVVLGLIALVLTCDTAISSPTLPAESAQPSDIEATPTVPSATWDGPEAQVSPTSTPTPRPTVEGSLFVAPSLGSGVEIGDGYPLIPNEAPPLGPGVEIGKSYPHDLYVHCGVRDARFDGRTWMPDEGPSDGSVGYLPTDWIRGDSRGSMKLISDDLAAFTANSGRMVLFKPWPSDVEWNPCA